MGWLKPLKFDGHNSDGRIPTFTVCKKDFSTKIDANVKKKNVFLALSWSEVHVDC